MSKANVIVPTAVVSDRSFLESTGIVVGEALDFNLDVVNGYQAARNPILVSARKASNEARIATLTAQLLADL
jgi:hypothetical protein